MTVTIHFNDNRGPVDCLDVVQMTKGYRLLFIKQATHEPLESVSFALCEIKHIEVSL